MDNLKPERRPWTARELGLLLVILAVAAALVFERHARQAGDLAAREKASREFHLNEGTLSTVIDADIKRDKKIDDLESRVIRLENANRKKEGY